GKPVDCVPLATIANQVYWFTVCDQGRVHTNITNLKRQFRSMLRWRGQDLWMIDIRNSQPLILAVTVRELHRNGHSEINLSEPRKQASRQQAGAQAARRQHAGRQQAEGTNAEDDERKPNVRRYSSANQNDDFDRVVSVCEQGVLYETVGRPCGKD